MSGESNIAETLAAAFGRSNTGGGQYAYKTMTSWSQNNFSIIKKIVEFLKMTHLQGHNTEPYTLDEILESIEQLDQVSNRQKTWLENEVLEQNPRIRTIKPETKEGKNKYQFKPVIDVKGRSGLKKYLMEKYQSGEGATWYDDILESVPKAELVIKWLKNNNFIVVITRQNDKKKVVFYNESSNQQDNVMEIDEDFVKLWRSILVEGMADEKIEEYLENHGIQSLPDGTSRKIEPPQKRRKVMRRQNKNFKAHNEHMKDILEDYSEK